MLLLDQGLALFSGFSSMAFSLWPRERKIYVDRQQMTQVSFKPRTLPLHWMHLIESSYQDKNNVVILTIFLLGCWAQKPKENSPSPAPADTLFSYRWQHQHAYICRSKVLLSQHSFSIGGVFVEMVWLYCSLLWRICSLLDWMFVSDFQACTFRFFAYERTIKPHLLAVVMVLLKFVSWGVT